MTVLVKRSLLTLDVKFLHHLQSTPLLHEHIGPSVSAMLGSIPGSPFLELCQVPAAIPLESLQWCRIFDPSSEASAWGRGKREISTSFIIRLFLIYIRWNKVARLYVVSLWWCRCLIPPYTLCFSPQARPILPRSPTEGPTYQPLHGRRMTPN